MRLWLVAREKVWWAFAGGDWQGMVWGGTKVSKMSVESAG